MSDAWSWATTAAANNSAPPDGFPENQFPSTVNNSAREVMAAVARALPQLARVPTGTVPSNGTDATNDIDFSAGTRRNSTNTSIIIAGAMTKRADATWAAGTGNGGMASGVTWAANDFHLHLLGKTTDPTAHDYIFDTSVTCANGLADSAVVTAGFTIYKRIASFRTAAAAWPLFTAREVGNGALEVLLKTPAFEFTKNWAGTDDAAQTGTLALVPGGIQVKAILGVNFNDASIGAHSALIVTSLDQTDTAANSGVATFVGQLKLANDGSGVDRSASGVIEVRTSTSRTFRYRGAGTTIDHDVTFCTHGWEDSIV